MHPIIIQEESVTKAARKAIESVCECGSKVVRTVGDWCLRPQGRETLHELHAAVITITNPLKRWNTRVNAGMLTETTDYLLGLNPGYTHMSSWRFYKRWIDKRSGRYPYTYGERIFGAASERNQWKELVKLLRSDPTTRHAHITLFRPGDLRKDFVPCNVAWHFQLDADGRLSMMTFCRSQDALRGLFLDCFAYTHFLEQMALATDLPLGTYTVFEVNLHIYDRDLQKVETDFAKPKDPYADGIVSNGTSLLTDEYKEKMHELLQQIYEQHSFPNIDNIVLPDYWRDWMISIAVQTLMDTELDFECILPLVRTEEISWVLRKSLEKKGERFL